MAVPTITTVLPATGPVGGRNVVTITGTNFNVSVNVEPPVRVRFDGVDAENVAVLSDTQIRVSPPAYRGTASADTFPAITVRVENVDDSGVPIVGEAVEATSAYTYERPSLRDPDTSDAQQIYRQVIYEVFDNLQRQVVKAVALGTSVDFGEVGSTAIAEATTPGIVLDGPDIAEEFQSRHHWGDFLDGVTTGPGTTVERKWPALVVNFVFNIALISTTRRELYALIQNLHAMFMRTPFIEIPVTFGDLNGERHQFPFVLTDLPSVSVIEAASDLHVASGGFEVRWIPFRLTERQDTLERVSEADLQIMKDQNFAPGDLPAETYSLSEPETFEVHINDSVGIVTRITTD